MKLGEKIIISRKKQGLSQVDLADALGVSRQSISKWETDEAKPEISKLPTLAKVLNVSVDWLLSKEDMVDNKEDISSENNSLNKKTLINTYPDWIDKAPNFMKTAIKKYGWIYGVKLIVSGAIFTIFGIVARVLSHNFIFKGNNGLMADYLATSAFTEINNQAWTAFSTITGLIIGFGLIIMFVGIILTIILKRWAKV